MFVNINRYKNYTRVRILEYSVTNLGARKLRLVEHVGSARSDPELAALCTKAKLRIVQLTPQLGIFDELDAVQESTRKDTSRLTLSDAFARGFWDIMGKIYDQIGLPADGLLKPLVLARIALPKSKLTTVRYLADNLNVVTSVSVVYRYMDTLDKDKLTAVLLAYAQKRALAHSGGTSTIAIVFYDVTTLYFETDEEDEDSENSLGLRKKGYSKDHRFDLPQVVVGLTVDSHGFPLDFQIYEGNTYEGQTLLAGIQKIRDKLQLDTTNLTVVADAGMLSQTNLENLQSAGYSYIVGARIRSLSASATEQILTWDYTECGTLDTIIAGRRMIVTYSEKRAKRSRQNRERLVKKLKAKLLRGDVIKKSKYVLLETVDELATKTSDRVDGEVKQKLGTRDTNSKAKKQSKPPKLTGRLDESKLEQDARFDGLKGYITNTDLLATEVITQYGNLWNVEKSFRMSKSDLRARPTFHYKRERIIAHLTLCVCALGVLKSFEERLRIHMPGVGLSVGLEQLLQIREYQLKLPDGTSVPVQTELTDMQKDLQVLRSQV